MILMFILKLLTIIFTGRQTSEDQGHTPTVIQFEQTVEDTIRRSTIIVNIKKLEEI